MQVLMMFAAWGLGIAFGLVVYAVLPFAPGDLLRSQSLFRCGLCLWVARFSVGCSGGFYRSCLARYRLGAAMLSACSELLPEFPRLFLMAVPSSKFA